MKWRPWASRTLRVMIASQSHVVRGEAATVQFREAREDKKGSMSSDTEYVVAIDLGSSGPKVSLVSEGGEIVARTSGQTSTFTTPDGGGEQDPDQWWCVIGECVRRVVGQGHVPVERIVAVSCASQWSVTVPVDRAGRHLMNAIHWSDTRGAVHTQRITDGLVKVSGYGLRRLARWVRLTGGVPTHSGADALAHILYIRHERPDVYRETYKLLEPMDYINFRLTGRAVASYASVYPYLLTDNRDNTHVTYDDGLIAWCDLDREKLPDLIPVCQVLGTIAPEAADAWGLAPGTKVVGGTPDSQAAAIGSGAIADFLGHVCVGTTAWLSCHVPFKKTSLLSYLATMPSALPGRNMVMAEQGAAGKCLQVFVENWLYPADSLNRDGMPARRLPADRRTGRQRAAGERGPVVSAVAQRRRPAQRRERDSRRLLEPVATDRPGACRPGRDGGGGLQPPLVARQRRAVRGTSVRRAELYRRLRPQRNLVPDHGRRARLSDPADGRAGNGNFSRRGDGRLAGPGQDDGRQLPTLARVDRTFLPDAGRRALYRELFAEFLSSYKANRGIFRRLNGRRHPPLQLEAISRRTATCLQIAESGQGILGALDAMMHPYREQFEVRFAACPTKGADRGGHPAGDGSSSKKSSTTAGRRALPRARFTTAMTSTSPSSTKCTRFSRRQPVARRLVAQRRQVRGRDRGHDGPHAGSRPDRRPLRQRRGHLRIGHLRRVGEHLAGDEDLSRLGPRQAGHHRAGDRPADFGPRGLSQGGAVFQVWG